MVVLLFFVTAPDGAQVPEKCLRVPLRHRDQAETENSVIMPVSRWGMWWQCSIQRAASPASSAAAFGGT
jgi:hypothetical protein